MCHLFQLDSVSVAQLLPFDSACSIMPFAERQSRLGGDEQSLAVSGELQNTKKVRKSRSKHTKDRKEKKSIKPTILYE
jgi:hypothetical protein